MPAGDDVSGCPGDLDSTSKSYWVKLRNVLVARGRWDQQDSLTLELYVRSLQRAREAQAVIAVEGRTTEGSQGQLVAHPEWKAVREAERDANDYARELGLTWAARAKGQGESKPVAAGELAELLG